MPGQHARLSPSGASRWSECTASAEMQDFFEEEASSAAWTGTVCHQIQEDCLLDPFTEPVEFIGREMVFWYHAESESHGNDWREDFDRMAESPDGALCVEEGCVKVTEGMTEAVEAALRYICEKQALLGGRLFVESRVPIGQFTGEEDAQGSVDVALLGDDWAVIIDSKFGFKPVHASRTIKPAGIDCITGELVPEQRLPNLQIASYALGELHKHDVFGDIKRVTLEIVQPFIDNYDSFSCTVEELREVESFLAARAEEVRTNPQFRPGYDACYFCRARGRCGAQTWKALRDVFSRLGEDCRIEIKPLDIATIGASFALSSFVAKWAKDVENAVMAELARGNCVRRDDGLAYKLVEGRKGRRAWTDSEAAEHLLSEHLGFDLSHVVDVISPAVAEQFSKPKRGENPRKALLTGSTWSDLKALIEQPPGQPKIVLETDPRPAIDRAEGFEDVGD